MYKLGKDKVIWLPKAMSSSKNIEKELMWLPKLEPHLPIAIPAVIDLEKFVASMKKNQC